MANPQKENGYTAISNEILDHFFGLGLAGKEMEMVLFVIRKTYGYQKKSDKIPLSQFQHALKMNRSSVCKTSNKLVSWKILAKDEKGYSLNKNWEQWVVSRKTPPVSPKTPPPLVSPRTMTSVPEDTFASVPEDTLKRKLTKETIQKKLTGAEAPEGKKPRPIKAEVIKSPEEKQMDQDIVAVFERFQTTINPGINFGHKTNRAAARWMIQKWGIERTLKLADYAISIHGTDRYAPTVTTPHELKEGYPKVSAYYKKHVGEQAKNKTVII
jgi:phage replication O-like protein O